MLTSYQGNYPRFFTNPSAQSGLNTTPNPPLSANRAQPNIAGTYQDEYGRLFGIHQNTQLPMRGSDQNVPIQYTAGQQMGYNPPSIHSSPRFPAPSGARTSADRSQPLTPVSAFPPILPSQKPNAKSTSASKYPSQALIKRGLPDADSQQTTRSPKRRPSAVQALIPAPSSVEDAGHTLDLSEEERLLVQLKQDQSMPWKEIAKEFEDKFGKPFQVPALQMRYKRLRERLRNWTNQDIAALEAAHEYWASNKYEIIANKMADFGVREKWPARYCERQWAKLHPNASTSDITGSAIPDHIVGTRFETDLQNHSIEWSIPSPLGETSANQTASPLLGLAGAHPMTSPTSSFSQTENISRRTRYDPT